MTNPRSEILSTVYSLLNEAVTIGEETVPVYSFAPTNTNRYIWLAGIRGSEDWTKDEFGGDWFLDINIIDRVKQGEESMANCLAMVEQVNALMQPTPPSKIEFGNGVHCVRVQMVGDRDLTELTEDGIEFRVLLEYRFMVSLAPSLS
jgi:hypothetical protein